MAVYENEKRKNDEQRGFPWWLLVVGFILGAVAMLIVMQGRTPTTTDTANSDIEGIELTATTIIEQATAMAQGTVFHVAPVAPVPPESDAYAMTATTIVEQATQSAVMTSTAQANP